MTDEKILNMGVLGCENTLSSIWVKKFEDKWELNFRVLERSNDIRIILTYNDMYRLNQIIEAIQ